jgi:hypothetical protein
VPAFGDEALEIRLGLRDRVRPGNPGEVETVGARRLAQRRLDALAVQKSRSA